MARQSRLSMPGVVHCVVQRGHNGGAIACDAQDAQRLLQLLRESAAGAGVVLHAYALGAVQLQVLATPDSDNGVSRMMQALGRHYAAAFNRRHGRSGALWDGRFRSALVEPGEPLLLAMRMVDGLGVSHGHGDESVQHNVPPAPPSPDAGPEWVLTSGSGRTGGRRDAVIVDPPEYWQLGNTPFERESRYRQLLAEPVAESQAHSLQAALRAGRAFGSATFLSQLAEATARPMTPRPRGRPPRQR